MGSVIRMPGVLSKLSPTLSPKQNTVWCRRMHAAASPHSGGGFGSTLFGVSAIAVGGSAALVVKAKSDPEFRQKCQQLPLVGALLDATIGHQRSPGIRKPTEHVRQAGSVSGPARLEDVLHEPPPAAAAVEARGLDEASNATSEGAIDWPNTATTLPVIVEPPPERADDQRAGETRAENAAGAGLGEGEEAVGAALTAAPEVIAHLAQATQDEVQTRTHNAPDHAIQAAQADGDISHLDRKQASEHETMAESTAAEAAEEAGDSAPSEPVTMSAKPVATSTTDESSAAAALQQPDAEAVDGSPLDVVEDAIGAVSPETDVSDIDTTEAASESIKSDVIAHAPFSAAGDVAQTAEATDNEADVAKPTADVDELPQLSAEEIQALQAQVKALADETERLLEEARVAEERAKKELLTAVKESEDRVRVELEREMAELKRSADKELQAERHHKETLLAEQRDRFAVQANAAMLRQQQKLEEVFEAHFKERLAQQAERQFEAGKSAYLLRLGRERAQRLAVLERMLLKLKEVEGLLEGHADQTVALRHINRLWVVKSLVESAYQTGKPLTIDREQLLGNHPDALMRAALESLPDAFFRRGVSSYGQLQDRFLTLRKEARKASYLPAEGGGVLAHAGAKLMSMVTFQRQSTYEPVGDLENASPEAPDAVDKLLARAEFWLGQGDLEKAIREVNQLSGWPRRTAQSWLDDARARLEVDQAVRLLDAQMTLASLTVATEHP